MKKSYNLTRSQKCAFDNLELAILKCVEEEIYIWSDYGTISAVNGCIVRYVAPDRSLKESIDDTQVSSILSYNIMENADDKLYVKRHSKKL